MSPRKWLESTVRVSTSWIPVLGPAVDEILTRWEDSRQAKAARSTLLDIEDRRWTPDSSPAALLRADFGVVPFHGREQELAKLHEWCEGTGDARRLPSGEVPHVALRVYTAPGGYGKTRLLRYFARQRRELGWDAGLLGEGKLAEVGGAEGLSGGIAKLFGGSTKSLLLVLDYAESRPAEVMAVVNAARSSRRQRIRLVLLARSDGDWWDQLQRAGDGVGDFFQGPAVEGAVPLMPLTDSPDARQEVFQEALTAFAEELRKLVPDADLPEDGEDFDRVLMIHAAALAAVEGEAVPSGGLLDWLLSREERGLERVREKHSGLGRDLQPAMAQAAALLTLAQGVDSRAETMEILDRVPDLADQSRTRRKQVVEALRVLYRGRRWCDGVEPDLVGENLVQREVEATPALLEAAFGREVPAARLENGLLVLNRLAQRRPEARSLLVKALRGRLRRLALLTVRTALANGDPIGQVLAEVLEEEAEVEVAAQLEDHLPERTTALRETKEVVTRLLLERLRQQIDAEASVEEQEELAVRANDHSVCLAALGRREEALSAIQESVDTQRRLATQNPDAFLPELARGLNNLSIHLGVLGRHEDGLTASQESVDIRRRLAAEDPDSYLPTLVPSLTNFSLRLGALGRHEDGLDASQEVVDLCRRLADERPEVFLPDLARSLNNLCVRLGYLERHEEGLAAIQDAVDIRRRLATDRPDAFLPDLAMSLSNLSLWLGVSGQRETGLAAIQESITVYQHLVDERPEAFLPDLAQSLSVLHDRLVEADQPTAALAATREALDHLEAFFRRHPAAYAPLMAAIVRDTEQTAKACGETPDHPRLAAIREILQQVEAEEPDLLA